MFLTYLSNQWLYKHERFPIVHSISRLIFMFLFFVNFLYVIKLFRFYRKTHTFTFHLTINICVLTFKTVE